MTSVYQKRKAYIKKYVVENRAKIRAYALAWKLKNRDSHLAKRAEYRRLNRDKIRAYRLAHPEQTAIINQKQRAKRNRIAIGDFSVIRAWEKKWRTKLFVTCYWCQKPIRANEAHSDHIAPVSKGGVHSIENLCISCASCNHQKYTSSVSEWNKKIIQPVLL